MANNAMSNTAKNAEVYSMLATSLFANVSAEKLALIAFNCRAM